MLRKMDILRLFPEALRTMWEETAGYAKQLQEIRVRAGKPVYIYLAGREFVLGRDGRLLRETDGEKALIADDRLLEQILDHMCRYSMYAYEEQLRQGFLTMPGGHRVGIAGETIIDQNKDVRNIKYIACINIRISHEVKGAADSVMPILYENGSFLNTLLISPPGCGKTTLLRDIVRQVSDGNAYGDGQTVGVVDERSELGGCYQGRAQNDLGMRTDILDACPKDIGMMMLLRSMAPRVIAVDELGGDADIEALLKVHGCGCSVAATIHGGSLEEIRSKKFLQRLCGERFFERYLLLGRDNGVCRVLEAADGAFSRIY